jgi:RHS repeat-associated protein
MGEMIAINDLITREWTYFVYGSEREAKITPRDNQQPSYNREGADSEIEYGSDQFYLYDHLGNTRITYTPVDEKDNLKKSNLDNVIDYYPYGKILREYRFGSQEKYLTTQHERDEESGLDYRGARYYDSDVARFLSLDPLANKFPEWSAYNYVFGNPIRFIDPSGRSPENADGTEDPRKDEEKKTGWTESHLQLMEAFGDPNGFSGMIANSVQQNNSTVQDKFNQLIKDATNKTYSEDNIDNITSQFNGYDGMKKVSSNKFKLEAGWKMTAKGSPDYGTMTLEKTQITISHKVNGKWTKGPVDVIKVNFSDPFGFLAGSVWSGEVLNTGYVYGNKFYIKNEDDTYSNPLDLSK